MYRQTSLARGKVRTTKRITDPPKAKPGTTTRLVAREGEEMSIAEAYRRGIDEKHLEPVGPAGQVALAAANDTEGDEAEKAAAAERAAREYERGSTATDEDDEDDVEYPVHDGGGVFVLSNGDRVRGREAAEAAEAELGDEDA